MLLVAQPAVVGFFTLVTVKVVTVLTERSELVKGKVSVSTPLAIEAVTWPAALEAQFAVHVATATAVESKANPARGTFTWLKPLTSDGTMLMVSVASEPNV